MPFLKKERQTDRKRKREREIKNSRNILSGKPEEKKAAKRLEHKQQDNTEVNF
jgi:hypothetical protein